ncbi:hypothetical protein J6590_009724 [Homalodisca vitripennis]|nr:hypothetical protein J6590_009724 [Homalodisca vitripennis]
MQLGFQYIDVPVNCLQISLGLPLFQRRIEIADLMLLHKIINGLIDCPDLLNLIIFELQMLGGPKTSSACCLPRLMRKGNKMSGVVEFFGSTSKSFQRSLQEFI